MLNSTLRKGITAALLSAFLLCAVCPPAFAVTPQENPDLAKLVFSSLTLLRYYSESLDFVLQKNAGEVETRLDKMPFANIPESLGEPTTNFSNSTISVSYLIVNIYQELDDARALTAQGRYDKATEISSDIYLNLTNAYLEVGKLELATEDTGSQLNISSAPDGSQLRNTYNDILAKIARIKDMLDLYQSLLSDILSNFQAQDLQALSEKLKEQGITVNLPAIRSDVLLHPTSITLKINPETAFVGDYIHFEGILTSEGAPLAGQVIDILLDGSPDATAITGADGNYSGTLQVPYWYVHEMDLQALYFPPVSEASLYLSSISQVVKLEVQFYDTALEITPEGKSYPGLETVITGKLDYGENPPANERTVEIYLDDTFLVTDTIGEEFTKKVKLAPETEVGDHAVTVSIAESGRYAPAVAGATLHVIRAIPNLDTDIPGITIIPGNLNTKGRIYSDLSPVSGATIKIQLGDSQTEFTSSANGTFDASLKMGMSFGIIGSQDLKISVFPQEPWYASSVTVKKVMVVNLINCGGILAIIIFLGIYLPGKLKRKLEAYPEPLIEHGILADLPDPTTAQNDTVVTPIATKEANDEGGEPRTRIFYWYRLTLKFVEGITSALLRPNQTLREFAHEASTPLGPVAKYFFEFTTMVEKLLYSPYVAKKMDIETSANLSLRIGEELGTGAGSELSLTQYTGSESATRTLNNETHDNTLEINPISLAISRNSRRQLSWLWNFLIMAVLFYAILLIIVAIRITLSRG